MIYLILRSYFDLLFMIGAGAMFVFLLGLYFILKPRKKPYQPMQQEVGAKRNVLSITSSDISAIAGDDVLATQLDLARAYIESGKVQLAKNILLFVLEKGTTSQQQEAQHLLGFI